MFTRLKELIDSVFYNKEDLFQAGCIGLVKAYKKFFITFSDVFFIKSFNSFSSFDRFVPKKVNKTDRSKKSKETIIILTVYRFDSKIKPYLNIVVLFRLHKICFQQLKTI